MAMMAGSTFRQRVEPLGAQVVHVDLCGAGHEGDLRVHQADGAGPDDKDRVSGDDGDSLEGVVDAGQGLDEAAENEVPSLRDRGEVCPGARLPADLLNGAKPPGC